MRRPLKWVLPVGDDATMVGGGPVIDLQMQNELPCLWTLEDVVPSTPERTRLVQWAGTGHPTVPDEAVPLGSVQLHGGALVFHLFDVTPQVG